MKKQGYHRWAGLALSLFLAVGTPAESFTKVDEQGRLERLTMGPGWARARTEVRAYAKGWSKNVSLSAAPDLRMTTNARARVWTGSLAANGADGPEIQVVQTMREAGGKAVFEITATATRAGELEGVFFLLNLPAEDFAGGALETGSGSVKLPAVLPAEATLWGGRAGTLTFADATQRTRVRMAMSPPRDLTVQDGRKWAQEFTAMVPLWRGNLTNGQSAQVAFELQAEGHPDQTAARASVDPAQVRYRVAGIGGNYCFAIESPVTRHTLEHLQVRAARTEMSLKLWAPEPPPAASTPDNYEPYAVADKPGSRVRRELELMQTIQRRGIPYTISVWRLPAWLGELASREGGQERWRIPPGKWPALLDALGTYLRYAKDKYQVTPDYFSFNEPDLGVDVLLTADEHRDAIKRIGAHFARLGLKTKLLLGDVAGPRGSQVYALPTANDPEALKYVGAVSFHSWGGAQPGQYAAWADLAERLHVPLIVAEAGPDPAAWQAQAYRTFSYAIREMVHYQELLLHARPQSILYWEFTGDYSLLAGSRPAPEGPGLTERFCFQKHWCDLLPPGSEALATGCDTAGVLVTAFRAGKDFTVHISNAQWERPITITGLPASVSHLQIIRTAAGEYFKRVETARVQSGKVTLTLPAESLTSLTTLSVSDPVPMAGPER